MAKEKTLWLARDKDTLKLYSIGEKMPKLNPGGLWLPYEACFDAFEWSSLSDIRLKPGEGPIKVKIVKVEE